MAKAFAIAADQLEESLADAFGLAGAYQEFVREHGSWLERVVDGGQ